MSNPVISNNDRGGKWYFCPVCNEQLDKFDEECAFCGEEIEWDEVEDDE